MTKANTQTFNSQSVEDFYLNRKHELKTEYVNECSKNKTTCSSCLGVPKSWKINAFPNLICNCYSELPAPPQEWLDDIEAEEKANAKKQSDLIRNWFSNPALLHPLYKSKGHSSGGGRTLFISEEDWNGLKFYANSRAETRKLPIKYENIFTKYQGKDKHSQKAIKEMLEQRDNANKYLDNGVKQICDIYYRCDTDTIYSSGKDKVNERRYYIDFSIKTFHLYPKGLSLSKINDMIAKQDQDSSVSYGNKIDLYDFQSNYNSHTHEQSEGLETNLWCFNVIQKEFKLLQESKRDFYTRYFTTKPFTAFEECGIEVLYARKGYAIDGKRLPNFNRGSVYGLKHSVKLNNLKLKDVGGSGKKDDLIKFLLKL